MEVWKDIIGYEGLYQISNIGRVKSFKSNKILQVRPAGSGYITYGLWKNGVRKTFRSHRLVGDHFLINNNNLPIVDHIDGVRHNNNVSNLRWVNHIDNINNKHEDSNHKVIGEITYSEEDICNEIWVDATQILTELKGKDIFMVSNLGRYKVAKRGWDGNNNTVLKTPNYTIGRYPRTSVRHNGKTYYYGIHQLVARCFIGEVPNGFVVDHIDSNIYNPRLSNLQIITQQENNKKANKVDDTGCRNGMSYLSGNQIVNILKDYHINGLNLNTIKNKFNIKHLSTLSRIINGKTYKNEYNNFMMEFMM
jgi:hypothetical protein